MQNNDELIYGKNPVTELLKKKEGVDTVFISESLNPSTQNYYIALAKECGAVVKKSVSLNSIDDVVTEYLVLNREIQTAKEALERLVEDGFIARKRYKNIEDLLIIAKARRKD